MHSVINNAALDSRLAEEAKKQISRCVHCGFCNATCPTYLEDKNELDGPRGRIYQIKSVLEGGVATRQTQLHLDRCLTCLNCVSTCPSGVEYNRLVDIGREVVNTQSPPRPLLEKLTRHALMFVLPRPKLFAALLAVGRLLRWCLPPSLVQHIPQKEAKIARVPATTTVTKGARRVLLLQGCVQGALTPNTNIATQNVLNKLGIETLMGRGCCGAVVHHLQNKAATHQQIKNNIDAWMPMVEEGCDAIISTASGCGVMVKDYAHHLQHDKQYAQKAQRISALCRDLSEVITPDDVQRLATRPLKKVAFHPPCTLQHGQKLSGRVEVLLIAANYQLCSVPNSHLCCGSAGTYSILQSNMSNRLRHNKLQALQQNQPDLIITANVGCQKHLQAATPTPVRHWIELFS